MESSEIFFSLLPTFLLRGGFAIVCGAMIGIERERKGKPAGFRTNTLICLGSTIYMLVSEFLFQVTNVPMDLTRIAAQVVTGIGFLGAGTIIQSRGTVTGLTSAATIWVAAGIGLFIGAGFPWIGLLCTFLTIGTLVLLEKIEPLLLGKCEYTSYRLTFLRNDGSRTRTEIAAVLSDYDVDISHYDISEIDDTSSQLRIKYCEKHPAHHRFLPELWRVTGITNIAKEDALRRL